MMHGKLEFPLQGPALLVRDAGDEHLLANLQKFGGDLDDLLRRLTRAKNDFGEIFTKRAVCVHLGKTQVGCRRGLKSVKDFFE